MKNIFTRTKDLFKIIVFCFRISLNPSIKQSRKYFIMDNIFSAAMVTLPFLFIHITSLIIGTLAGEADGEILSRFIVLCLIILAIGLLAKFVENFKQYCDGMYREILNNHISILMMEKSAGLDVSFFDSPTFYNEMRDATNNVPLIAQTTFQAFNFIRQLLQMIIAVILMSRLSWLFTILLALSIIPHVVFQRKQLDAMYNLQRGMMGDERKLYYLSEILYGREYVKDAKLFNLFPFIRDKFCATWKMIFVAKKKLSFRYTVLLASSNLLPEMVLVVFMVQMGIGVINGTLLLSDYSYYYGIAGEVMACMYMIVYNYSQLMDGKARIENYLKFMEWESVVKNEGELELDSGSVAIEFRNVFFQYGCELPFVLKDISFTIRTPEKTAIVGVNGSGKSTIVRLLMRFYDPTEGEILLNGLDIRKFKIESIRKCFSTMFQDYPSYAFTVRESVAISDHGRIEDIENIEKALDKSDARLMVSKFATGLETYLTRQYDAKGVELSGGEWQKISAARTFFREASVLVLDEPSAALDAESEDRLFRQLESECVDKCAVLISHRLSNVINADQILVLDDGVLIECGTHIELMKQKGKYAELFNLQAGKYKF